MLKRAAGLNMSLQGYLVPHEPTLLQLLQSTALKSFHLAMVISGLVGLHAQCFTSEFESERTF
jgi:hypothetical protein